MAYTVAFLSLQFFELYRADPDFRYQLLQVLQQAERAEYADEQQQRYRFALLDVRNVKGLTPEAVASSSCVICCLIRVSLMRWPILISTAGLLISFHMVVPFLQIYK